MSFGVVILSQLPCRLADLSGRTIRKPVGKLYAHEVAVFDEKGDGTEWAVDITAPYELGRSCNCSAQGSWIGYRQPADRPFANVESWFAVDPVLARGRM